MRLALATCAALLLASQAAAQKPDAWTTAATTADAIAVTGHGMVFDARMRRIDITEKSLPALQASLARAIARQPIKFDAKTADVVGRIDAALKQTDRPDERAYLLAAKLNRQLDAAEPKLRARYAWRNRIIYQNARGIFERQARLGKYVISDAVLRLIRDGGLILTASRTAYMDECAGQQVPVPPNFSMASTTWFNQGNLASNMLRPGNVATVWTWTDPVKRGACVALPRDNGGPGSFAGIICQSAVTGKACFWDNLTRADPGRRIPVATETMVIRDLQDGRTLDEMAPCTECHTGNNVFLMLPDDPAWRKLLRGPLNGAHPANFSTIFEPQANTVGGSPRYTPIAHASWVNPPLTTGCSGPCHGAPSAAIVTKYFALPSPPPMPPACRNPGNNFRNCYGTP